MVRGSDASKRGLAEVVTPDAQHPERFGIAWNALTVSLAAHVVDEALTGFLDVYNPIVRSLRARYAWFPMPVFTFGVSITGLCVAVVALFALSPLALKRSPFARIAAYPYAAPAGFSTLPRISPDLRVGTEGFRAIPASFRRHGSC